MKDFKMLSLTIHDWQAAAMADAISFINNLYGPRPVVAFSLDNIEHDLKDLQLSTNECVAIVIHYFNETALAQVCIEFGRRSLGMALGFNDTSKMQPSLPIEFNKL